MRVTTAFKRLMDLPGVTVTDVDFQPAKVVVTVNLRSRKLSCPACAFTTKARYDSRPVSSSLPKAKGMVTVRLISMRGAQNPSWMCTSVKGTGFTG